MSTPRASRPLAPVIDSLEARWFCRGALPPEAAAWFGALGPPVPEETRTDRYLIPAESADLGLKVREGTVQAKQRTGSMGLRPLAPGAAGTVEAWRKWTLGQGGAAPQEGWVDVRKARRQRARIVAARGGRCALELAQVEAAGETWWSVCLEASGVGPRVRWLALREGARRWLRRAPALPPEASMGYPAWLRRVAE